MNIGEQVTLEILKSVVREYGQRGASLDDAMAYAWNTYDFDRLSAVLEGHLGAEEGDAVRVREALNTAHKAGLEEHRASSWLVRYTIAPAGYDGFGTEDLGTECYEANRGRPYRKVRIDPRHYEWQRGRYMSGCFPCLEELPSDACDVNGVKP